MDPSEKPTVICCGILRKEMERLLENGDLAVRAHFLSESLHMDFNLLRRGLVGAIEKHRKRPNGGVVVVYGDVCLGFNGEMRALMKEHDVVKVDGLNCIDCLLGGGGRLLEMDPDHKFLFLTPAWIQFDEDLKAGTPEEIREMYSVLEGIVLLDAMGDLDDYQSQIDEIVDLTGLPIIERREIGLAGFKAVMLEALERHRRRLPGGGPENR